jgi:hypothetical protein
MAESYRYGTWLDLGFDQFEELAGAREDPGNSAATERYSGDWRADDHATIILCVDESLIDIGRLEAQVISPAAALGKHRGDWGVLAQGCDQFNLGCVIVRCSEKVDAYLLNGIIKRSGNDSVPEEG